MNLADFKSEYSLLLRVEVGVIIFVVNVKKTLRIKIIFSLAIRKKKRKGKL
jgi:hypothetical protein